MGFKNVNALRKNIYKYLTVLLLALKGPVCFYLGCHVTTKDRHKLALFIA